MLSNEQCRYYLPNRNLTDEQIEQIRNFIYCITENVVQKYLDEEEQSQQAKNK